MYMCNAVEPVFVDVRGAFTRDERVRQYVSVYNNVCECLYIKEYIGTDSTYGTVSRCAHVRSHWTCSCLVMCAHTGTLDV